MKIVRCLVGKIQTNVKFHTGPFFDPKILQTPQRPTRLQFVLMEGLVHWFRYGSKRLGIKMSKSWRTFCRTMVMKSNPKRAERKLFACVFGLDHQFATVKKPMAFFPGKVSSNLNRIQSQDLPRDNSAGKFPEVSMEKIICGSSAIAQNYRRIVRITVSSHKKPSWLCLKMGYTLNCIAI